MAQEPDANDNMWRKPAYVVSYRSPRALPINMQVGLFSIDRAVSVTSTAAPIGVVEGFEWYRSCMESVLSEHAYSQQGQAFTHVTEPPRMPDAGLTVPFIGVYAYRALSRMLRHYATTVKDKVVIEHLINSEQSCLSALVDGILSNRERKQL